MFEAEHIFHQEIGKVSECSKLQYDILVQIFLMTSESSFILTLLLLNTTCPVLANSVDPDQLASEEANWSVSALFVIKYVNFYQKLGSSNLIGWKLEVGVASIYSAR